MYEVQSNTKGYDHPDELSFTTLPVGSGASHSGRGVAAICQPDVLPLVPPPAYSELTHTPPPSYREVMGLESDVESAEVPPTSPHRQVATANYRPNGRCRERCSHRCVTAVATPILVFLIGACCWYLARTMAASPLNEPG